MASGHHENRVKARTDFFGVCDIAAALLKS